MSTFCCVRGPQPCGISFLNFAYSSSLMFLMLSANAKRCSLNLPANLLLPAKSLNMAPAIRKNAATRKRKNGMKNKAAPNNTPPMIGFKILLFILVDGWNLIVGSVVRSFG